MFNIFKKKSGSESHQKQQQESTVAPGTEISYDPELVGKLKNDHQALLGLYGEIKAAFDSADYPLVTVKLNEFKTNLVDHLLVENVRLYIYLGHSFASDEINNDLVKEFRAEMGGIAKVVMAFLTKYETIGVDADLAVSFGKDLEGIAGALVARINREEGTLYPLYLPAY